MSEIRTRQEALIEGPAEFDFSVIEWLRLNNDLIAHAWSPVVDEHRSGWCTEVIYVPVAFIAPDGKAPKCPRCQNAVARSLVAARPDSRRRMFRTSAGGHT